MPAWIAGEANPRRTARCARGHTWPRGKLGLQGDSVFRLELVCDVAHAFAFKRRARGDSRFRIPAASLVVFLDAGLEPFNAAGEFGDLRFDLRRNLQNVEVVFFALALARLNCARYGPAWIPPLYKLFEVVIRSGDRIEQLRRDAAVPDGVIGPCGGIQRPARTWKTSPSPWFRFGAILREGLCR